jgi:hypothetical protein
MKKRIKSGNTCCHSVQSLLYSGLLSKNVKIEIHNPIIFLVVLYWCEIWSLTLREDGLKVAKYYQEEEDEMSSACSRHERRVHRKF